MRTYEALYIVRPDLEDGEIQTVADGVQTVVTNHGGAIVRSEIWGRRRLAYEVQRFNEGCYVLLRFEAPPEVVRRLEHHFRLSEEVIRHIVVHYDEQTLRREAEQHRKNEEKLQATAARRGSSDEEEEEEEAPRRRRAPIEEAEEAETEE